jgi:hypothetical protein
MPPTAIPKIAGDLELDPECPALAGLEDERIWIRDWVCVGVAQQIPDPGDLLPATVGDHGLHVQRQPDGTLRAAFNVLQQGSCWTVPVQCGSGHKTRCPYVSCAFSLDTDALRAVGGEPTREMRQFIGFNPLKLFPVMLECLGPLIFLRLDPSGPDPLAGQLGELPSRVARYRLPELVGAGHFWIDLDCNWKLADAALLSALGGDPATPTGTLTSEELSGLVDVPAFARPHREVWGGRLAGAFAPLIPANGVVSVHVLFPNLVLAFLPNHLASLVVKPTALNGCKVLAALHVRHAPAGQDDRDEAMAELRERWAAIAADARARSRNAGTRASPILAAARERLTADTWPPRRPEPNPAEP